MNSILETGAVGSPSVELNKSDSETYMNDIEYVSSTVDDVLLALHIGLMVLSFLLLSFKVQSNFKLLDHLISLIESCSKQIWHK